jgi:predicted dehydrogenase
MSLEDILKRFPLPPPPSAPVRLGIVGCGGIARSAHYPALKTLMDQGWPLIVSAVCDLKPENLDLAKKQFPNAKAHTDSVALLSSKEADAYLFCLFPEAVEKLLPLCFERGIPLLVEKPVSHDPARLSAFAEEAERRKAVVQVAFNRRYAAGVEEAKERVSAEKLAGAAIRFWRRDRVKANFYHDTMVHAVNLAQYFLGSLELEKAEGGGPQSGSPLTPWIVSRLRNRAGVACELDVRPAIGQDTETYEFFSQGRTLHWAFAADRGGRLSALEGGREDQLFQFDASQGKDPNEELSLLRGFTHQMAHFISGFQRAGFNPRSTLRTAWETATLADRIRVQAGADSEGH